MIKIDNLSTLEGRQLIQDIYLELRYEKQFPSLSVILLCWRICVYEREIFRFVSKEYSVLHPLGFFAGTALWLQEIINRYYFSTVNSFVYFGAAVLLVLVGLRRFSEYINDDVVIAGVAFEALMLVFMFVIMLFTPNEELKFSNEKAKGSDDELINEIGEIGRDFAAAVLQLEQMGDKYNDLITKQSEMIVSVNRLAQTASDAVAPNPDMINIMKETNTSLSEFKENIKQLNKTLESLKKEEIEYTVKRELEKILVDRIYNQVESR